MPIATVADVVILVALGSILVLWRFDRKSFRAREDAMQKALLDTLGRSQENSRALAHATSQLAEVTSELHAEATILRERAIQPTDVTVE